MKAQWPVAAVCALLVTIPVSARQAADPRNAFVQALGEFSLALEGGYGDEGGRIRSSLDAMDRALSAWDATIQGYEASMRAERRGADPPLAARMHMAIGGVYLDRIRIADALREFSAASELDPSRADVQTLIGLTRSQLMDDLTGATAALRKASELDPADPVRAYVLGQHLLKVGEPEEALKAFARFRENQRQRSAEPRQSPALPFIRLGLVPESSAVEPFFPPVLYAEGFELLRQGELKRALGAFRDAAARDPLTQLADADPVLRAAASFKDGAVAEAVTHLRDAIKAAPDRAEPHRLLGLVYAADGQYDNAVAELTAAVRLSPMDERARMGLADALTAADRLDAAAEALEAAIAALPASGLAHYKLARLHGRQGSHPDARRELDAALTLNPMLGVNGIYERIGSLERARQDFDSAIEAYRRRIDVHPNDPAAHHDLGDIYLRQSRHEEALAEFTVALMLDPARVETHVGMAQAHLRDGRYQEAVESSRRAVALDSRHEQARYTLATALMRAGNVDEGTRELAVFKQMQAAGAAALSRLFEVEGLRREATVATAAGDHQKAVALLHRVFVLQPEAASSHLELGLAHLRAGQHAEAIDRLGTAAALNPTPDVHRHLAEAYAAMGMTADSERERLTYERLKREAIRRGSAAR